MQASIVVSVTEDGKTKDATFSAINPKLTPAQAQTFGQLIAGMSTHKYKGTTLIHKYDCDDPDDTDPVDDDDTGPEPRPMMMKMSSID